MATVLLVDDDDRLRRILSLRLQSAGYSVVESSGGADALSRLEHTQPQLVLTDLRMPEMNGMELLERLQIMRPGLPVVMLTAHGDIPDAVAATRAGAVEFLTKPVDTDELLNCIACHVVLEPEATEGAWAEDVVTRSAVMRNLLEDARRVAQSEANILLSGPSGSGKEVLARALHRASPRHKKPFVALNCGAMPAELLESELFGHRKGAFTGAQTENIGLFRAAEGGTILLDEVGDMPAALQVKLLRVLQEREVRPVGEQRAIPVDVRVLSATHRDLKALVDTGDFREDLLYRLQVVTLTLPSLNERREDIPLLAAHQLGNLARKGAPRRVYAPEAMELLAAADWPGNVRQLFNVIEQNVALAPGKVMSAALVRKALGNDEATGLPSFEEARAEFTRNYLRQLMELAGGNVSQAARLADRNRTDFYKLLNRYDLDPRDFKSPAC